MAGTPADGGQGSVETRGRPQIRTDDEILRAAFDAFATQGYDATSLRALNTRLGLSHRTISQRFGSKERLYFAAADLGFTSFIRDFDDCRQTLLAGRDQVDDLEDLRITIRAFLDAAHQRPEMGRLINQEGQHPTKRLRHIVDSVLVPLLGTAGAMLDRLRAHGRIRPITTRELFFLVTAGAEAPYALSALSAAFDILDGPLVPDEHADTMTDLIMRAITAEPAVAEQPARTDAVPALAGSVAGSLT